MLVRWQNGRHRSAAHRRVWLVAAAAALLISVAGVSPIYAAGSVAISADSALGATKVGPFSTTTKVAALNQYVTWRFSGGAALADKSVEIWVATKNADGSWGAFTLLTARVADASGNAYFWWRSSTAKWISVRAYYAGDATHSASWSPARQANLATISVTTPTTVPPALADGSVTSATILDGTITAADLADDSVSGSKIVDGTITAADLAPGVLPSLFLADGAVTSAKILDGTIASVDLAAGSVTSAKILDGTITAVDLADSAVTSARILDGAVTTVDLAGDAVTSAKILDGTIATADIADGAVTSAKILDGTIATADIADGAVTLVKLSPKSGTLAVDPPSIAAATCAVVSTALTGVAVGDKVFVQTPADLEAGLVGTASTQDAADSLKIRICNITGAAVDGASRTWTYVVIR